MSDKSQSESYSEMPIFTKSFDFLNWLVTRTNSFPRLQRHTVTRRLLDAALDFQEALLEANSLRGGQRLLKLQEADASLAKVRLYLRLAFRWKWLNPGQYEHVSRMVAELGRLLGGWQRVTKA